MASPSDSANATSIGTAGATSGCKVAGTRTPGPCASRRRGSFSRTGRQPWSRRAVMPLLIRSTLASHSCHAVGLVGSMSSTRTDPSRANAYKNCPCGTDEATAGRVGERIDRQPQARDPGCALAERDLAARTCWYQLKGAGHRIGNQPDRDHQGRACHTNEQLGGVRHDGKPGQDRAGAGRRQGRVGRPGHHGRHEGGIHRRDGIGRPALERVRVGSVGDSGGVGNRRVGASRVAGHRADRQRHGCCPRRIRSGKPDRRRH